MNAAIVIPAFNEADSIAAVVSAVSAYGTPIVVDDGSSDDTATLAARAGAVVVRHDVNRGQASDVHPYSSCRSLLIFSLYEEIFSEVMTII